MTSNDKPKRAANGAAKVRRNGDDAGKATDASATAVKADAQKPERISKLLARAGVASRRDVERLILEGRVTLNGTLLDTPVVNATLEDKIEVDGIAIRGIERTRLWLYHKPAGLVTTNSDPEGRRTVFEALPEDLPRVMSIGRLDINTEGLLLLTNDGGLARVLELPTTGWLRRYRVRAFGEVDQAALDKLKEGIAVDGVLYGSIDATLDRSQGHNVWITMGLREGKNREIKNVLGALGLEVNRLIRISYGPFQLGDLPEGDVVEVRGRMLRDQLGPRLIEDAKANFDAPIFNQVAAPDEEDAPDGKPQAKAPKARKEKPEDRRERALERLDTRSDAPRRAARPVGKGRDAGRGRDRDEQSEEASRVRKPVSGQSRTANVWMAPGARPVAEKKKGEAATAEKRPPRARPAGGVDNRYGRDKDGKRTQTLNRFDPDRRDGGDRDRSDRAPRVQISRTRDDEGEWIRAEAPPRRKDEGEGFGAKRGFGDRPRRDDAGGDRFERPERGGDRPRTARSFEDRPRDDRSREDRPRGERPFGEKKPFGDKPRGPRGEGRPAGDRPFGDRPRGPRTSESRSTGDRPFGDKPRGPRGEGRPAGDRPFGDRPRGPRTSESRSTGDRPFGDKPRGPRGEGRPAGDRPFGDRPRGPRTSESRSTGDRPFGDKPRGPRGEGRPAGDRPFGDRPKGGKSFGGKPGGRPAGGPGSPKKSFSGKPGGRPSGGGGKPSGGRGPSKGKR